ncbi:Pantetheinase-like protein [Leptotrombidium deliense]|uniref:Pantetheinase-like protein n=1 Tax=Leptotrombidium deliense TaxID=299467 RepID=A0A443SDM3_9ACAR|nr:Pantetheinase-like protein [Leptotrombidium deliense]
MKILITCLAVLFYYAFANQKCFRAAVYEGALVIDDFKCAKQEICSNLEVYEYVVKKASQNKAQIIVFPEHGLFPAYDRNKTHRYSEVISNKMGRVNPCDKPNQFANRPIQLKLSCAAKKNRIYIVANLAEVEYCHSKERGCPKDGRFQYNTAIAFDANGVIVAKYRKYHLFGETAHFDYPKNQEFSTFITPFGRFGLLICFDSLFEEPALGLIKQHQVTTLAMPTWWYNEHPFLVAHEYQQSIAIAHNVNFLAANANKKEIATTGSGIYSGKKGAVVYKYMSKPNTGTLLISTLSIDASDESAKCNPNSLKIPIDVQKYSSATSESSPFGDEYNLFYYNESSLIKIKLNDSNSEVRVCKDRVCCQFAYSANESTFKSGHSYYVGVGSDIRNIPQGQWCEEMCALYAFDETINTYALLDSTEFNYFKLIGTFTTKSIYPSVLTDYLALGSTSQWHYTTSGYRGVIESTANIKLIAAGLYGRCFDRDPALVTSS